MDQSLKKIEELSISPPDIPIGSHPVESGSYLIDTLEIKKLEEIISDWIKQRLPGALVYGNPRLGKSYAIEYLMRLFEEEQSFQTFRFNCQKFPRPNENSFFEFLLRDVHHKFYKQGRANEKRDRLFKFLLERGDTTR